MQWVLRDERKYTDAPRFWHSPRNKSAHEVLFNMASPHFDLQTHEPRLGRSVSIEQAAQLLNVSRRTVYNRIREGRLQTIRTLGGSQRVLLESLHELLGFRPQVISTASQPVIPFTPRFPTRN